MIEVPEPGASVPRTHGPLGAFLRQVGGLPVNRAAAGDLVEQTAAKFKERASLVLVIMPEGTRARVDKVEIGLPSHRARGDGETT